MRSECSYLWLVSFLICPQLLLGFVDNDGGDAVVVFATHEGNFSSIINPSLVVVQNRLLIFAEARLVHGGDGDPSRIGIKHSDDGGETWSAMRALLPEGQ